jgi:hypothetical protein
LGVKVREEHLEVRCRCELLEKDVITAQMTHIRVDDFSGGHQRENLFRRSRKRGAHGLSDHRGHLNGATDKVLLFCFVLLDDRHVVGGRWSADSKLGTLLCWGFRKWRSGFITFWWRPEALLLEFSSCMRQYGGVSVGCHCIKDRWRQERGQRAAQQ